MLDTTLLRVSYLLAQQISSYTKAGQNSKLRYSYLFYQISLIVRSELDTAWAKMGAGEEVKSKQQAG